MACALHGAASGRRKRDKPPFARDGASVSRALAENRPFRQRVLIFYASVSWVTAAFKRGLQTEYCARRETISTSCKAPCAAGLSFLAPRRQATPCARHLHTCDGQAGACFRAGGKRCLPACPRPHAQLLRLLGRYVQLYRRHVRAPGWHGPFAACFASGFTTCKPARTACAALSPMRGAGHKPLCTPCRPCCREPGIPPPPGISAGGPPHCSGGFSCASTVVRPFQLRKATQATLSTAYSCSSARRWQHRGQLLRFKLVMGKSGIAAVGTSFTLSPWASDHRLPGRPPTPTLLFPLIIYIAIGGRGISGR